MNETVVIMIVEDSPTQVEELRYILEQQGYEVSVTRNGREALQRIRLEKPAIVISDVMMPEIDGYELCRQMKTDEELKNIPVILVTWLSDPTDVIKGLECGADNFIIKPYNHAFILSRLRHILINKELRKNGNVELGLEIFFAGQKYFLNSERIQIIDLLLATYENSLQQKVELEQSYKKLQKAHETITNLEQNYRALLERNVDAMIVVSFEGIILYASPAAEALLGHNAKELLGQSFAYPVTAGEAKEVTIDHRHDVQLVAEMRVAEVSWQGKAANLVSLRDVTENVHFREQLRSLSFTDELTGLYNRRGLLALGKQQLNVISQIKGEVFLFFIDVDGMKVLNDTYGHYQGDLALIEVSNILKKTFRETDIVCRLGGDEFAALAVGARKNSCSHLLARLQENISEANAQGNNVFRLSVSVGIAYYDYEHPCSIEEMLVRADKEMYEEKRSKNCART